MIGTLKYLLDTGDTLTLIISILFFVYLIVVIMISKKIKDNKILKILCIIPVMVSLIHFIIYTFGSAFLSILPFYLTIYIPAIIILFMPLVLKKKIVKKIYFSLAIIVCFICSLLSIDSCKVANYTNKSLSDAYISLCDYLEENYVLSTWKKINYDKVKEEGLILIKEAEENNDIDKYYEALDNIVKLANDGHMGLSFYNTDYNYTIERIKEFNNYGLSLITLENGETIAVNTLDDLEIKDGDVITKWNNVPIKEAIDNVVLPLDGGTIENTRIQKTFYLAGLGGKQVEVTYINSNNEEKVVTLNKIEGQLTTALTSFGILNHTKNEEYMYKMLNNDTGYLRVVSEETNVFSDTLAYLTGNHNHAREKFRKDLRFLKSQGMKKLVIDIRNNSGGFEEVATALTSLFTKEKMYAFSLGVYNDGKMEKVTDRYVYGDGEFSDLEIVVLTGMRCGSAGDGLSLYLSRLDNVTVAGISDPAGINQEVGGYVYMPKNAIITFPTGLILDEEGNPNIDIDETKVSRNPVDIKIPLTKESALKIFNGEDYEIEWAIDYLNSK